MQIPKILIRCQLHPNKWYRKPRNNLPQNINPLADSDGNTDLSLVEADHVTWILTCHWSISQYSWGLWSVLISDQIIMILPFRLGGVLTQIGADIIFMAKLVLKYSKALFGNVGLMQWCANKSQFLLQTVQTRVLVCVGISASLFIVSEQILILISWDIDAWILRGVIQMTSNKV